MKSLTEYVLKFFATMKDSLQETLDSKVLYAMMVLSAIVIVAVASIKFEPKSGEKGVSDILGRFTGAVAQPFGMRSAPLKYELADFKQTDEKKPWEAEDHFTIVVHEIPSTGPDGKVGSSEGAFR